jgi:hypothetical protein
MATLDVNAGFEQVKSKINATKAYGDLKNQYDNAQKKVGDSFEQAGSQVTNGLNQVNDQVKSFKREIKNQFEQLLDINNLTGGKGSNSIRYVKKLLLKTVKNIEPKIRELLLEEAFNAVGCDQEQTYTGGTSIYIKVKSVDLVNMLKKDYNSNLGKLFYEKQPLVIQNSPFSMNKELYERTQSANSYSFDNGQFYLGRSGQPLFDIQYTQFDNFGQTGPWFKVDLQNRLTINKVGEFMVDYYSTIKILEFPSIMVNIMESLSGCISIKANVGLVQSQDATKFELLIQRILGLCFDNVREIDVSGVAKIAELDGVDNSFFEFTDIDLRNIDQKISNIKKGVIQFEECDFVDLPVNTDAIIDDLTSLFFVPDNELVDAADQLTQTLINNPQWGGLAIRGNVDVAVNFNFVKLIVQGIVSALLTPKILLPIFIMLKALGQNFVDLVESYVEFVKKFSRMAINLVSKIGALFVKELFELIKKDLVNLIQQVVLDVAKEKGDKRIIMILKLIQLLLIIAQFITDWRKCKSVVDELLQLLTVATTGWGGFGNEIPLPLLLATKLLDGYSESRAFIGAIEEMQKLGIPTGAMPDGSPNLDVLSKFAQMKAMAKEDAENNKLEIVVPPITMTPAGVTAFGTALGKKI